jgi:integrase
MSLTIRKVAAELAPGRYGDGAGLYLQVTLTGTKSWLFRYETNQRERWMGLGSLNTFNLAEARERARKARQLIADGIDPLEARAAEKARLAAEAAKLMTFANAADQYYAAHEASWSNAKHRQQFRNTMAQYVLPKIGRLSVAAVDTGEVLKCIEPLWKDKTATANRVRGRIESVLDWATVRGYRKGDNPARWRGHLSEVLPAVAKVAKTEHHNAMPYAELPAFMAKLATAQGVPARALEFLILTAARTSEVSNAPWDEIDLQAKTWTIPAERMKADRDHKVPLSDRAVALLQHLPREGEFVFVGAKAGAPISWIAMSRALKRITHNGETVHGFRSTFSDWAHERTGYANHVIELSLAHSIGSAVEKAYRRGDMFDKRRRLMSDWARYCSTKPAADTGNVVAINR